MVMIVKIQLQLIELEVAVAVELEEIIGGILEIVKFDWKLNDLLIIANSNNMKYCSAGCPDSWIGLILNYYRVINYNRR